MASLGGSRLILGIGIGIAVASAARRIAPAFRGVGRPLAKAAVKSTLILMDRSRLRLAELKESVDDMAAEARAELADEARQQREDEWKAGKSDAAQSAYQA